MADFPPTGAPPATSATSAPADDDLWIESYRQANAYARDIYAGFFNLARISFAFNAVLFAGLAIAFGASIEGPLLNLIPDLLFAIGVFGLVYNVGAGFSYYGAHTRWYEVHRLLKNAEEARADRLLLLQDRVGNAERKWGRVSTLTLVFFALLVLFWLAIIWYVFSRLRWDVYVFTIFM